MAGVWMMEINKPYSGTLGLGMGTPKVGASFFNNTRLQGPQWSYLAGPFWSTNTLIIGGYNSSLMAQGTGNLPGWHPNDVVNSTWMLPLSTLNTTLHVKYMSFVQPSDKIFAVMDVQSDVIGLPATIYTNFTSQLVKFFNGSLACPATAPFCSFNDTCANFVGKLDYFRFCFGGRHSFGIPISSLLMDDVNWTCRLKVSKTTTANASIGNPFFRFFYTAFDVVQKKISFAPAVGFTDQVFFS